MSEINPLVPRQPVPALSVPLAGGGTFTLSAEKPEHFTLVVFYRGLHCPLCRVQLKDFEAKLPEFEKRGVSVVAISSDPAERGEKAKADWGLPNLRVGHSLSLESARAWGLFVSAGRGLTSVGLEEPALFSEPGLFLIRPNGELYFGSVQTMPFARPQAQDILGAIDFVVAKNYPGRGEITDIAAARAKAA
jgi:peroxiredoxin